MIRVLDQKTIDQIAAGEVIERPSSVVKELTENALDAGASRITIEIRDGGKELIRVTDNGSGIEKEDVRRAFLDHATSKLRDASDLVGVTTLGFRGEALSTIAAVSETEMITKCHDGLTGVKYVIRGGKEVSFQEIGATDGTTIIVRTLFFNTPARLKFLKSSMTEGAYITDLVSHIALAKPECAVHLISNGKTMIDTAGDGRLRETVFSLYGKEIARSLIPVNYENEGIRITGFAGKPFLSKGNRSFENYYVNKRYIKSPVINRAIEEAYKTYVMQHRFPFTVLFLELPPEKCDVNVHPAKREFRYENERELFHAVYHAVSDALRQEELIPDAEKDYGQKDKLYRPAKQESGVSVSAVSKTAPVSAGKDSGYETLKKLLPENYLNRLRQQEQAEAPSEQEQAEAPFELKQAEAPSGQEHTQAEEFSGKNQIPLVEDQGEIAESPAQTYMPDRKPEMPLREKTDYGRPVEKQQPVENYRQEELSETKYLSEAARPKHRIIGQVFRTYWITEYENALYIMDQHAAHEKVNYETFLKEFRNRSVVSQQLYPPLIVTLSAAEKTAVMNALPFFRETGFDVEDFGEQDVKISAVPVNLVGLGGREIFLEFAAYLAEGVRGMTEDIFVHKIATMGCKAAIKGNQEITPAEAQTLIDRLMTLDNPYTCPHGRPTIIRITKQELDKKFRRIVE